MIEIVGGTAADRQAIHRLHETDMRASRDQDFATLRTLMSDDAVVLAPRAAPVRGRAELDASFNRQRSAGAAVKVLSYAFDWREVEIVDRYAFEWGKIIGQVLPHSAAPGVKPIDMTYNVMRILRKEDDGSWKVYRTIWNDAQPNR